MRTPHQEVASLRKRLEHLEGRLTDYERSLAALAKTIGEIRALVPGSVAYRGGRPEGHAAVKTGRIRQPS